MTELGSNPEYQAREMLRSYLKSIGRDDNYVDVQTTILFDEGGYVAHFSYCDPWLRDSLKARILVSGCAIGTELKVAERFGFREVVGTEVDQPYIDIVAVRFREKPNITATVYDGEHLPFEDRMFSFVASSHIIEHTRSPFQYLREHLRVLNRGGMMFIEFPTRYHWRELHTGLPSLEWLPTPLRNLGLFCTRWLPISPQAKAGYRAILGTLRPVSVWQIKMYLSWVLRVHKISARVGHHYSPAPGYVRMLIIRNQPAA